jgi:hypothetical protein
VTPVVNLYTGEPIYLNTDEFIHEAYTYFTEGVAPGESYKNGRKPLTRKEGLPKFFICREKGFSFLQDAMKTHNYSDPTVQNALGFFKVALDL